MRESTVKQIENHIRHYIVTALQWHPIFDDGRGGNDLTLHQTADLMTRRLCHDLAGIIMPAPSHGDSQ